MNGRNLAKLAPTSIGVGIGALALILVVALTHAAPPRPRPVPRPRARPRARVRPARVLPRQRRPLVVRRHGARVVIDHRGRVVRKVPPPVVITTASDLRTVPAVDLSETTAYKVARISDGSMPVVSIGGQDTPVRLIGVEPAVGENGDDASKEAAAFFRNLVVGEYVYLEYDPALTHEDEDGRRVAYLYRAPDKMLINLELIRQGYALATTDYDYQHKDLFSFYEGKAATDGKGIWVSATTAEPAGATETKQTGETGETKASQ